MGAVKSAYFDLINPGIPARVSPLPHLNHIHLLTYFGEPIGAYADNASAMADLEIMRRGAWLNSHDEQSIDAYAVKTMRITRPSKS
jgi:hypothetical protein